MFSARKQQQNDRKQVYRSSQLQLYVHCQDGISSWDTFFLREMNYSVFLYILDNFFPKKKKMSVTLIKNTKYLWNYDAAFKI